MEIARVDDIPVLVLKAVLILVIGLGMGLVYNTFSETSIFEMEEVLFATLEAERLISLEEAREAFDDKSVVFVDARSTLSYNTGHIPGARTLPVDQFEDLAGKVLSGLPNDTQIITYCSGSSCQSSVVLAQQLAEKLGYTRVRAFQAGWSAWVGAGYPVSKATR